MDATTRFVADVTVALIAGSLAGSAARALRVSPVLGYLIAGVVVGPFTPGYSAHPETLAGLAELGLIFLLFSLGLGFSPHELRDAGVPAIAGNLAAMGATAAAVWFAASRMGIVHPVTLALAFTVSSTAVGAALLQATGLAHRRAGRIAISLLIAQDLIAVVVLVVTSTPASSLTAAGVGLPLIEAVLFVIVALALGATLLHRLFLAILHRASSDLLVVIFSAVALAAAWLGHLAGLTFEFGAFVAGAVTSEAAGSRMVQSIVAPFRELFVMLFFVAMGTLVDVGSIGAHWQIVSAVAAVAVAVRWLVWTGVGRSVRLAAGTAAAFGFVMLPMGEFNIVLGRASLSAGRLDRAEVSLLVGTIVATIAVSAIAARIFDARFRRFEGVRALGEPIAAGADVVILGYGRVGQTVASMVRESGIAIGVIEREAGLVRLAERDGLSAVYGDGADPATIDRLLSDRTQVVLTTLPDSASNAAATRRVRARSDARVIARAERAADVQTLADAGAVTVLVPEIEGARAFGKAVLEALRKDGATTEQQV